MEWRNQVAVVTGGSRGIGRGNSATCSGRHSRRRIVSGGSEGEATKLFAAVSA